MNEEAKAYLRERPLVVAGLVVLASTFLLGCVFPLREQLALVVANTLLVQNYLWNIVTAHLYEGGLIKLLLDGASIIFASRSIPSAQLDQFALYFVLSLVAAGVGASLLRLAYFSIDQSQEHLTKAEWGAGAVTVSLAMYTRLEHASTPITPYSSITFNQAIPLVVAVNVLLSWLGIGADGVFSVIALLFCWSYLRHLYRFPDGALGERSQETQFIKMFPSVTHSTLSAITAPIEKMFARMGVFGADLLEPTSGRQLPHHHLRTQGSSSPTSATLLDPVKERRMQLARKMLEERREVQQQIELPPSSI